MSVNGVTGSYGNYAVTGSYMSESKAAEAKPEEKAEGKKSAIDEEAAVYEPSSAKAADEKKGNYKPNAEMINKLKADAEAHVAQLQDIVNKLLSKQGETFNAANGLKSFYQTLEVDEETKAQAQKDIAEDGYWGVEQTSSRIFDFAMALSGGDPDKMDKMKEAFYKGYAQATKAWGDELPDICKDTYDAVVKKFDDYKNGLNSQE